MYAPGLLACPGNRLVDMMILPLNTRFGSSAAAGRASMPKTTRDDTSRVRTVIAVDATRSRFEQSANCIEPGPVRSVRAIDPRGDLDRPARKCAIDLGNRVFTAQCVE